MIRAGARIIIIESQYERISGYIYTSVHRIEQELAELGIGFGPCRRYKQKDKKLKGEDDKII